MWLKVYIYIYIYSDVSHAFTVSLMTKYTNEIYLAFQPSIIIIGTHDDWLSQMHENLMIKSI